MAYILYKHDGIVERLEYSKENLIAIRKSFTVARSKEGKIVSPCASCDNCYANKCPKVADKSFRNIKNYPFISHGYEIIDEVDGRKVVTDLYIDSCDDYVIDHPRKKFVPSAPLKEVRIKEFRFGFSNPTGSFNEPGIAYKKIR